MGHVKIPHLRRQNRKMKRGILQNGMSRFDVEKGQL